MVPNPDDSLRILRSYRCHSSRNLRKFLRHSTPHSLLILVSINNAVVVFINSSLQALEINSRILVSMVPMMLEF